MYIRCWLGWLAVLLVICTYAPALSFDASSISKGTTIDPSKVEKYRISFYFDLKNNKNAAISEIGVFIPVPEDDAGQKISDFSWHLSGYGSKEVTDQFGQKSLRIDIPSLAPGEKAQVGYSCNAEIKPVCVVLDRQKCGTLAEIPLEIRLAYCNDVSGVYDLNSPLVREVADKLREDYPNLVDRLKAIHDYVAGRISYNLSGHWESAPAVIQRKTGSCSEYSFVFGALCRANGLPTRMVGSTHLRTSTDFPYKDTAWHRWVEVYLPPYGWIPFDPTLDRGKHPSQNCCGSYDYRTMRISRGGVESNILGHSYVGCTTRTRGLERDRYFIWEPLDKSGGAEAKPSKLKSNEKRIRTDKTP